MNTKQHYDAVIIGAGVAGALIAKQLTHAGLQVLLLEAGPASAQSISGYETHIKNFYTASGKGPESAWPPHPSAPQPDTANLRYNNGYFVQNGPDLYGSSYTRLQGGSTLHWLGVALRMLPEDFKLHSHYGVGRDWPIDYVDLEAYYRKAELELGVAADKQDQEYHDIAFPADYDYPMQQIPQSYADQMLAKAIDGMPVTVDKVSVNLKVRSYPAARNSVPRGTYQPVGAVDRQAAGSYAEQYQGQRCSGNSSCTPICPIQAKYNAGKTLAQAVTANLELLSQAVAAKINIDTSTGDVTSISYQRYHDRGYTWHEAIGRVYVLAAHAVENAKLMLASGLSGTSGLVGKNLMDHPTLYAFGLAPEPVYPFRGPLSTSGIEELRGGAFRAKHAAFRFDIGNDGWKATTGAPDTTVLNQVMHLQRFGRELKDQLAWTLARQVRLSLAVEQLPNPANGISLDWRFLDPLGNPRPAINYRIDDYTLAGMAAAAEVCQAIFAQAGISTTANSNEQNNWFPTVNNGNNLFHYHGMGHFAGTHLMGDNAKNSVVNSYQRAWEHNNLYLVGSGSFATMGTSNPTLTLSALALRTAEHIISQFNQ